MSSGEKTLVVNTGERAVSTDIMRAQAFKAADINEIWRALSSHYMGAEDGVLTDLQFSSQFLPGFSQAAAPGAVVVGGLLAIPQAGVTDVLVDGGVAFLMDPDSPPNPDDSNYKMVVDPGVSTIGVLQVAANASGSIRIDVLEVARVAQPGYSVIETDNRDIFDPTSGLFAASTVNKVVAGRLQYRIRQGTPGSGFPGAVSGWLPLMVASVPAGSTNNDACTFWDVRPLLSDRAVPPWFLGKSDPSLQIRDLTIDASGGAGQAHLTGYVTAFSGDTSVFGGPGFYRLGGSLVRGTPGTDLSYVDLNDTANQAGSMAGHSVAYVYLIEPFGLPRWVRYTDAPTRKPRAGRGMLVVSGANSPMPSGVLSSAILLPTSTGLGGTTQRGICVAVAPISGGVIQGLVGRDNWQFPLAGSPFTAPAAGTISPPIALNIASFALQAGTHFPINAKTIKVRILLQLTVNGECALAGPILHVINSATANDYYAVELDSKQVYSPAPATLLASWVVDIPVTDAMKAGPAQFSPTVFSNITGSNVILSAGIIVEAWKL